MDEKTRTDANARLGRIAGQVAGIKRMLAEDRYCVDVLLQIAAVQGALGEVGRVVLANHVETCLTDALRSGTAKDRAAKVDELMDVLARCTLTGGNGMRSRSLARSSKRQG